MDWYAALKTTPNPNPILARDDNQQNELFPRSASKINLNLLTKNHSKSESFSRLAHTHKKNRVHGHSLFGRIFIGEASAQNGAGDDFCHKTAILLQFSSTPPWK